MQHSPALSKRPILGKEQSLHELPLLFVMVSKISMTRGCRVWGSALTAIVCDLAKSRAGPCKNKGIAFSVLKPRCHSHSGNAPSALHSAALPEERSTVLLGVINPAALGITELPPHRCAGLCFLCAQGTRRPQVDYCLGCERSACFVYCAQDLWSSLDKANANQP